MNIVIYLIQHGANPDYPTVRGETSLHLAARAQQTDIIRILLRNGATVDARARVCIIVSSLVFDSEVAWQVVCVFYILNSWHLKCWFLKKRKEIDSLRAYVLEQKSCFVLEYETKRITLFWIHLFNFSGQKIAPYMTYIQFRCFFALTLHDKLRSVKAFILKHFVKPAHKTAWATHKFGIVLNRLCIYSHYGGI